MLHYQLGDTMIRDFQIEQMKERKRISEYGVQDVLYPPVIMDRSPYIYYCMNLENEILYVGHTQSIANRMSKHIDETPWWCEVSYIFCAETPTLEMLVPYKRFYIQKLNPKYNKVRPKADTSLSDLSFRIYQGKEVL